MHSFHWSKSNEVFLAPIDDEHRAVFQATGELQKALRKGSPRPVVEEILHRLIAGVENHFAHEERLMRDARYLSFSWHKGQHDTARKRLREFVPRVENGDIPAGEALVGFLKRWLDDHTAVTDRMLGAYLRNQQRSRLA
jgi:hemerythrin